ncbi:SpoIIE family protein phosphatase [Cyanobacterium sp. IPPAS B-1200]|uniref:SpoIIE family protein phosphatase n=1 Tax=Cyanobacterium sp. IPPAS B-1200 TaxID=1562720 RepID=UPI00085265CF|nr:SpoIIE family protein phosphatase [Cyanobacterium sp. IPPAS B-1200]OEJ79616.1 response regulator receiver protein [Cyanobacterium sp. IPPAS B-1200]
MSKISKHIKEITELNPSIIANLRHDLRTPINAILGYSEMLLEDLSELEEEQEITLNQPIIKQLSIIQRNGKEILSIINQLLKQENQSFTKEDFSQKMSLLRANTDPLIAIIENSCELIKADENNNKEDFAKDLERIYKSSIRLKNFLIDLERFEFIIPVENPDDISNIPIQEFVDTRHPKIVKIAKKQPITGHILAVDDNENNRELLYSQLTREGYAVSTAINGKQALEMIAQKEYDLILLDLLMPEIDGYQVLETLKQDPQKKYIPVIMISALDEMDNVIRCIEIGAEDYLPKPFNKVLLRARIEASLEKKNLRDREIQYLEKLNKELEKGREVQLNFLPSQPLKITNWEIATFFKPARQVAGDFYDTFTLPNGNTVLVLADVCDKGVGAALFMGLFRSLIRIFTHQHRLEGEARNILATHQPLETSWIGEDDDINLIHLNALQAVSITNNYIANNHGDLGMFATMFVGILNPENGLITYINGGHESLYVKNSEGKTKLLLKSTGPAVGMMPGMKFNFKQFYLEVGDTLFGNTDGVTDARTIDKEFFRTKRLEDLLDKPYESVEILVNTIKDTVIKHIGEADQFDDLTMLAVRRLA